jgi:hypothetical protein
MPQSLHHQSANTISNLALGSDSTHTFPNKLRPPNPLPDLILVRLVLLTNEGFVQACAIVVVTLGVVAAHEEEVCGVGLVGWIGGIFGVKRG